MLEEADQGKKGLESPVAYDFDGWSFVPIEMHEAHAGLPGAADPQVAEALLPA